MTTVVHLVFFFSLVFITVIKEKTKIVIF